jgi:hypothetical protein
VGKGITVGEGNATAESFTEPTQDDELHDGAVGRPHL